MSTEAQLTIFSALINLESTARDARDKDSLNLILVNNLQTILPCGRATLLRRDLRGNLRLAAASGVPQANRHSPFGLWIERLAGHLDRHPMAPDGPISDVIWSDLPEILQEMGREFHLGRMLWCPLNTGGGTSDAILLLQRESPWLEPEKVLAGHLSRSLGHAVSCLEGRRRRPLRMLSGSRTRWLILAAILLAGWIPVNMTAIAPAEIVPLEPSLVTAPMDGVIETVHVQPHSHVSSGAPLFSFDATTLKNEYAIAEQELALARAKLRRAEQDAFRNLKSNGERAVLEEEAALQETRLAYTEALLNRVTVMAIRDGIVIFNDPDDLIGRPVQTGQEVMSLADPKRVSCRIMLPVAHAIVLAPGSEVTLFLDTAPLQPLKARLAHAAYQAEITPQGYAAFRLEAHFASNSRQPPPRIGLRGTAKLRGEKVTLAFYLLHRPLAVLRQFFGM
ncbi:MAG: HlyD family efflux transporter periplasmic adaptor subunit [Magnetococcus sp. THC-1_WYH]